MTRLEAIKGRFEVEIHALKIRPAGTAGVAAHPKADIASAILIANSARLRPGRVAPRRRHVVDRATEAAALWPPTIEHLDRGTDLGLGPIGHAMWAFSDESERANVMIFGLVLVRPEAVDEARTKLRGLLLPGQRKMHTSDESARRRRLLLDTVVRIEGLSAVVLRHRRPVGEDRVTGRRVLLAAGAALVVQRGVNSWTLDDLPPSQRNRDRATIGQALQRLAAPNSVVYDHRRSHTEPLLWAADAICWAVGAGGDWQRRIATIVTIQNVP